MRIADIVASIDGEIQRLTQARNMLSEDKVIQRQRGRPVGTRTPEPVMAKKSSMTSEGRKRIAEAMRKRWAERRATLKAVKSVKPVKPVKAVKSVKPKVVSKPVATKAAKPEKVEKP